MNVRRLALLFFLGYNFAKLHLVGHRVQAQLWPPGRRTFASAYLLSETSKGRHHTKKTRKTASGPTSFWARMFSLSDASRQPAATQQEEQHQRRTAAAITTTTTTTTTLAAAGAAR
eukprot:1705153-Amphidinium_carterae.1